MRGPSYRMERLCVGKVLAILGGEALSSNSDHGWVIPKKNGGGIIAVSPYP